MEGKKGFILYIDTYEAIKDLPVEEKAQLLDAIFLYHKNPENPVGSLGSGAKIAFSFLLAQFKRDIIKYEKRAQRSRENGRKGGRPKTQRVISKPRKPDRDRESEKDINNLSSETFSSIPDIENLQVLDAISPEDISSISEKYQISEKDVLGVLQKLRKWVSDGKQKGLIKDASKKLDDWVDRAVNEFRSVKQKKTISLEQWLEEETGHPVD